MEIKGEHLLFLFGAGASVDANIPISNHMVTHIEKLIDEKEEWQQYKDLYYYLKSSIHYSDGIFGRFGETFNVEKLLVVITEIEKRDKNIMYPFIGAWNIRLLDLAGSNFGNITKLKNLIRKQLNEWVRIKNYDNASYYEAFDSLQGEIGELIKVFTLNYDLCFERVVGRTRNVEVGFNKGTRDWHFSNFENTEGKHFFLYKLHGSIDWYTENEKLYISDDPVDDPELIFGIQHKMTSVDPYFYYSSELRRACINDAKLIVTIGYSFADEYVNVILSQALKQKSHVRLLCVGPVWNDDKEAERKSIALKLSLPENTNQIIVESEKAKQFMGNILNKDYLASYMAEPDNVPF
ncbi:SIR2 family protein [Pontibacter sp. Tf4]|uniref:SIR2 family protein n=1 Tax=Pontibacter sp. Tf4 TaxID=2761620 RepID=UPI00162AEB20|nr:SIR2 family protein [Pontibacter sp. Tf4]MBB6613007.1 SIR2 family protein [Pontibacter sp. Tf4]